MTEATLTNNLNSRQFLFETISPVTNTKRQPLTAIPLPNADSSSTLLFRLFGQEESVQFSFAITTTTVDRANGTAPSGDFPSGVLTIDDQIKYLRDYIFTADFDASWNFTNNRLYDGAIECVIEDLTFDNAPGGANFVTGSITLKRGNLAGI